MYYSLQLFDEDIKLSLYCDIEQLRSTCLDEKCVNVTGDHYKNTLYTIHRSNCLLSVSSCNDKDASNSAAHSFPGSINL